MIIEQNKLLKKLRGLALKAFLALDNSGTADFATNGEQRFIEELFRYLARYSEQPVFFDIGANIGEYTGLLLEKSSALPVMPEIHVFEPTNACFAELTAKYAGEATVKLNQLAVSNSCGAVTIYYDSDKSVLASLHKRNLDAYAVEMNRSETVATTRLDAYIESHGLGHINFLKIDIEGHELAAFEGLGRYLHNEFIDFIQFEYGGANLDSHTTLMDFYMLFEKAGFVMTKVMSGGLEVRPYRPWMDNYHYANYVAVSKKVLNSLP